jgi:hypothetical protein
MRLQTKFALLVACTAAVFGVSANGTRGSHRSVHANGPLAGVRIGVTQAFAGDDDDDDDDDDDPHPLNPSPTDPELPV